MGDAVSDGVVRTRCCKNIRVCVGYVYLWQHCMQDSRPPTTVSCDKLVHSELQFKQLELISAGRVSNYMIKYGRGKGQCKNSILYIINASTYSYMICPMSQCCLQQPSSELHSVYPTHLRGYQASNEREMTKIVTVINPSNIVPPKRPNRRHPHQICPSKRIKRQRRPGAAPAKNPPTPFFGNPLKQTMARMANKKGTVVMPAKRR